MLVTQINNVGQKYITKVLDIVKMALYSHVKVAIPEVVQLNKIIVLGQYVSKLEKVFCHNFSLLSNLSISASQSY